MSWIHTQGAVTTSGSGTSTSVSFNSSVANGHIVIGFVFTDQYPLPTTLSVTDDKSNIYTVVNTVLGSTNTWWSAIFWSGGVITNAPTTITVNTTPGGNPIYIVIDEFAPPTAIGIGLDGNATGSSATSNTIATDTFITVANGDLVYSGVLANVSSVIQGTGFTAAEIVNGSLSVGTEYLIQSLAGSTAGTWFLNGGGPWTINAFAVKTLIPSVTGVEPDNGTTSGNTSVTISGTNFTGTTSVKFGATSATSFTVNSATQITAITPAGSVGTVDVTVTTSAGTSIANSADDFTYQAPPIVTINHEKLLSATFGGINGSGTISVPGLKAGDTLIWLQSPEFDSGAVQMNTTGYFEIIISVDDQIKQLTTNNLSTFTFAAILIRGI